jgi:hypothetical protein
MADSSLPCALAISFYSTCHKTSLRMGMVGDVTVVLLNAATYTLTKSSGLMGGYKFAHRVPY